MGPSTAPSAFPAIPDLSGANVIRFAAGIRPFREGAIRLEVERMGAKWVVHNYGHGGSGITLSWGSGLEAVRLVQESMSSPDEVAVLGAGIIGLSTARILLERGIPVSIYADQFTPNTTSDVAGGLWAPSDVGEGTTPEEKAIYRRLLDSSYRYFEGKIGPDYGVERVPLYVTDRDPSTLTTIPSWLLGNPVHQDRLPFFGPPVSGFAYESLKIPPYLYMPRLFGEVQNRGARLETRRFRAIDDLMALPQSVVVNCLGLGAGELLGDKRVLPVRGQVVHVRSQPAVDYVYLDEGYMIPRGDVLLLGGTFEPGVSDPTPDPVTCQGILEGHRRFFAARTR